MLMAGPATGDMHTRDAEAKKASENTAMAARKAVEQGPPSTRRAKFVPVTSQEPEAPKPIVQPPRRLPLSDYETKAEQARLLTLLRTIPPVDVVNQICKALAYFGGTPDAPPPADGNFPLSEKANGPGKFFVGWISEIFPYVPNLAIGSSVGSTHVRMAPVQPAPVQTGSAQSLPAHIASAQVPAVPGQSVQAPPLYAPSVQTDQARASPGQRPQQPEPVLPASSGKRPRGRPKGSGSSKVRQGKRQTTGSGLPHTAQADTAQQYDGDDSWVDVEEKVTDTAAARTSGSGPSTTAVAALRPSAAASNNATSSTKRRGRPKGSKNRPKETKVVPNPSAVESRTGPQASQPIQHTQMPPLVQQPHSTQPYDGLDPTEQSARPEEAAQPPANVSSFTPVNQTNQTPVAPAAAVPVLATPVTATPSKKKGGRPKGSKTKTKPPAIEPTTAIQTQSQGAVTAMNAPPPQPTTMQQGYTSQSQPSLEQWKESSTGQGKATFSVNGQARAPGKSASSTQQVDASSSTWNAAPQPAKSSQGTRGKQNDSQGQVDLKQAQSAQDSSVTALSSVPKPLAANPNQSVTSAPQPERQKRKYTKRKSKDISLANSAPVTHSQFTDQQAPQGTTHPASSNLGTSISQQDPTVQQPAEPRADDSPGVPPAKKARRAKKSKADAPPAAPQKGPSSGTVVPAIPPSSPAIANMSSGAVGSVDSQVRPSSRSAAHDGLSLDDVQGLPHGHFGVQSPTMENYEAQLQAQLDQEAEPQLQLLQDAISDVRDEPTNLDSGAPQQTEQQPRQSQQTQHQPSEQYQQKQTEQNPWLYQQRTQQQQQKQPLLRQQATQQASQPFQKQPADAARQSRKSVPHQHGSMSQAQLASPVATQAAASGAPSSHSLYRATGYQVNAKQSYSPQQTGVHQEPSAGWQQNAETPTQNTPNQQYTSSAGQHSQRQQPQQYASNQQSYSGVPTQWPASQQQQASGQQRYQPHGAASAATTSYNSNTNQPIAFLSGFSSGGSYRSSPTGMISPFSTSRRLQSGNSSMSAPANYRTPSGQGLGQPQNRASSMDALNPGMGSYQQQQHQRNPPANMSPANPQQGMGMGLAAASMPSFNTNSQTADWALFGGSNAGQQQQPSSDISLGTTSSYGVNNRTTSFPATGMPSSTSVYGQASLNGYDTSGVLGRPAGYYGNR